jgi:dynein heavy chain
MKKVKRAKLKKRHIEDVPFYNFKHGPDDLPLDPARNFIIEEIGDSFINIDFPFFANCGHF